MMQSDDGRSSMTRPGGPPPRVVDRHNEVIGQTVQPEAALGDGSFEVELSDGLHEALGCQEGRIRVPSSWVAGVRRNEIRLSMGLHDPELTRWRSEG